MSETYKVVFAGTPEFAVPSLQALIDSPHRVVAVYTQPDRPAGRGRKLTASPVKTVAAGHGIPVHQPPSLKKAAEQARLAELGADLMVVTAYGLLLPPAVLAIPRLGCINVHASLLPRWRGAAPINYALLAGDDKTGITIMQMDAGLDTGDMLHRLECPIEPDDTAQSLHDRLSHLGARALLETLAMISRQRVRAVPQPDEGATYASKLDKDAARLDWTRPARELERMVRAFNPWPIAYTELEGAPLRIWQAHDLGGEVSQPPGTLVGADARGMDIACGQGILRVTRIQRPGGRAMAVADYLHAHPLPPGTRLGTPEGTNRHAPGDAP
ncbi:MAG TPA: methionyl-tRNA formyltransferase [Gammaproteobacteria bacterium]|nr:methionyl-tRNA formyltransferase [Gammaproteobacteria bacterium]